MFEACIVSFLKFHFGAKIVKKHEDMSKIENVHRAYFILFFVKKY